MQLIDLKLPDDLIKAIERSKKMNTNMIDYSNMWNLGATKTGGKVSYGYTSTSSYVVNEPDNIFYKGEKYRVNDVEISCNSIDGYTEITIRGHKVNECGISGTLTIKDPGFITDFKRAFNPYPIKKVVVNPSKNATTVIFEDGSVEVVKKSPDDPEADIFSVVAYAVAKHVYGSNSAFKREVLKNLDFIDREFEEIINRTPVEDLQKAMNKIVEHIKKKNRKEAGNDA